MKKQHIIRREQGGKLMELRLSGYQPEEVAQILGTQTTRTVQNRAPYKKRVYLSREQIAEAMGLRAQGLTQFEVANRYGCDPSTISRIERKLGGQATVAPVNTFRNRLMR